MGLGVTAAVAAVAVGAATLRRSLVARQLRLAGQDRLGTAFVEVRCQRSDSEA